MPLDAAIAEEVLAWVRKAEEDLAVARMLLSGYPGPLRGEPVTFYALVNTTDAPRTLAPHPAAVPSPIAAMEYWTGEAVTLDPGVPVTVESRDARLFVAG